MNSCCALALTFLVGLPGFHQPVFAQQSSTEVPAVKTGDKVHQVFFSYRQQGSGDPVKEKFRNFVGTMESGPESYKFSYPSGRIEEFSKGHALISINGRKFPQDQVRSWMPKEGLSGLHGGASWKTAYNFSNPGVCDGRVELEAVSKIVSLGLKIDEKETTLQVVEITMNGFGQCSQGTPRWKESRVVHFSKELNLALGSSSLSYDPQGFLYSGSGFTTTSLEILK